MLHLYIKKLWCNWQPEFKENNFDFYFATWKNRKTNNANIGAKTLKQQPQSIANQVTCEVLSNVKDPMNYQVSTVHKYKQKPIDFKIDNSERPTMVNINENVQKKRVEKRKMLEKQLSENTIKMKKLKANNV